MNTPSSSISSSPPDLSITSVGSCQICEKPGHGNHFGAITCRACAAFFRRFGVSNNFNYCNKNSKCRPVKSGTFICKHCRLKKCKMMGMTANNFQFQRDSFFRKDRDPELNTMIPFSVGTFLGRSNLIILSAPESEKNSKRFINVQFLLENSLKILANGSATPIRALNSLEKLSVGFQQFRYNRKKPKLEENKIQQFGMLETFQMWESDLLSVAKWLTYFDEFQELPFHVRVKILKGIWTIWSRFEKFESAALDRRKHFEEEKWEKKLCKIDISWCSRYTIEELKFFGTDIERLRSMMQSMLELELTDVELTYMICQLCLQHVGKRLQGEVLETCDRLQDILSDNLHDYYTRNSKKTNYSARVVSMMKYNNFMQKEIYQRRVRLDLMKVFDIFTLEFSDPELFMDY